MDVIDERELVERAVRALVREEPSFDDLIKRRHRKRRNQRIAAGVVGIAVFVAAVWIVTSGLSFDRTQTPAVPGGATGPKVSNPTPKSAVGPVPETDYFLDLSTGEMTPLPKSITGDAAGHYAASPDGSRLAFTTRGDNGKSQVFVAKLDGTGIEQVTHALEGAQSPAWSPDGSKIAYVGADEGFRDLYVLDLATGASTQLTFETSEPDPAAPDYGPWGVGGPSFTPDGTSIVYSRIRWELVTPSEATNGAYQGSQLEVRTVPVVGGKSVRLMGPDLDASLFDHFRLSPDGSLLSYSCGSSWCVAKADGTGERALPGPGPGGGGSWSPDGTRIAYFSWPGLDVSVMEVATGHATYVAEGWEPTWLNDHTLIVEMPNRCYDPAIGAWIPGGGCPG